MQVCIYNDELCNFNDEYFVQTDEFCVQNDGFFLNDDFLRVPGAALTGRHGVCGGRGSTKDCNINTAKFNRNVTFSWTFPLKIQK